MWQKHWRPRWRSQQDQSPVAHLLQAGPPSHSGRSVWHQGESMEHVWVNAMLFNAACMISGGRRNMDFNFRSTGWRWVQFGTWVSKREIVECQRNPSMLFSLTDNTINSTLIVCSRTRSPLLTQRRMRTSHMTKTMAMKTTTRTMAPCHSCRASACWRRGTWCPETLARAGRLPPYSLSTTGGSTRRTT